MTITSHRLLACFGKPRTTFFLKNLAIGSVVLLLGILAFTPMAKLPNHLFPNQQFYQGLILDGLHFPGTWVFTLILLLWFSRKLACGLVLISIFLVELIQIGIGRESSWVDIAYGVLGLAAGLTKSNYLRLTLMMIWASIFSFLFYGRSIIVASYPTISDFNSASVRSHWHPTVNDKIQQSKLLFLTSNNLTASNSASTSTSTSTDKNIQKARTTYMRVVKNASGYWGAYLPVNIPARNPVPTGLEICTRSQTQADLTIRLDDRSAPEFSQRINIDVPTNDKLHCHQLQFAGELQRLADNGSGFEIRKANKIAVFTGPDSQTAWFDITRFRFLY